MENDKNNQLEILYKKRDEINKQIKEISDNKIKEQLKKTEKKYLGHCFENDKIIFKIVCIASTNEYRVSIIGFKKEPKMKNDQDIFDSNFKRHPFQGETSLDFVIEDDIMIKDLKLYHEITKDDFELKLTELLDKLKKEMTKEFKLKF